MPIPPLTIQLFGPLRVLIQGEPMPRVRTRSVEWLLALLVLRHGRTVDRSWLAGTLWPDSEESQALQNLRDALMHLRKALGSEVTHIQSPTRDTLTLDLEGAEVDVVRFDAAMKAGDEESIRSGVEVYVGPLLEGCLEEWIFPERASREQSCLKALETLAETAEQRQEYALALSLLQMAKGLDTLRDSTQRGMMRILAASGDVPAALYSYREYRLLLREQMNVEPDAETIQLYQQIRATGRAEGEKRIIPPPRTTPATRTSGVAGDPGGGGNPGEGREGERQKASVVNSFTSSVPLPHPITALIGREQATQEVAQALSRSRLVTLVGAGGIGKTRLAIQAADIFGSEIAQETAFVGLASLSDPSLLPAFVAKALGIRENASPEPDALLQALVEWLSSHAVLLVLDNCEHLIEAAASLAQTLLERCPDLHLLATSRQRLGLMGEVAWRVPSLPVAEVEKLPSEPWDAASAALNFPAIQLFVERASSTHREFHLLRREEVEAVCRICSTLDGIPLAIELAAARAGALTVEGIHSRLDQRFRLLTGGSPTALPRQKTLRSLIDWSYELLDEAEKALLCRLSVFSGGWMLEAAEQVCSDAGIGSSHPLGPVAGMGALVSGIEVLGIGKETETPPLIPNTQYLTPIEDWEVLDLLTSLVDKSLVMAETSGASVRYRLLETIREYARDRLLESEEDKEWRERHLSHYLALAEEAAPNLRGPEQQAWFERLEREHDNLRQGLAYCLETAGKIEAGLRLAGSLQYFWLVRGYFSEGRKFLSDFLGHPEARERTRVRASALNGAGHFAMNQRDYASARSLHEESLAIRQEQGDRQGVAGSLHNLGVVSKMMGDFPGAKRLYEEALQINREIGTRLWESGNLEALGTIALEQGEYAEASALYEQALAISKELGNKHTIANCYHNLGVVAMRQGDYVQARTLYEQALAIRRELGDRPGIAHALNGLGDVIAEQGDYAFARSLYEESLAIRQELGDQYGAAASLHNLGRISTMMRDFPRAKRRCEEALQINREIGDRLWESYNLDALGSIATEQGEYAEARSLTEQALAISKELGNKQAIANFLHNLGSVARSLGNYASARSLHDESLAIRQELGDSHGIADSLEGCAGLAASRSNPLRAARLWGATEQLREQIGAPLSPYERSRFEAQVAAARAALAEDAAFDAAWQEGRVMTIEQAIGFALSEAAA